MGHPGEHRREGLPSSASVPTSIGGHPTVVETVDPAGLAIEMVCVRDLESRLDRRRLLADEDYVPPYWALVWSGSIALGRRLGREIPCRGRRVLDVGCGLGLVSLAAARAGGVVTAIDREPVPIAFLRASSRRLGLPVAATVADLETEEWERRFDLVLCAELLYESARFEAMAEALDAALAPGGSIAIADARRVDTTRFWEAMAARGFVGTEHGTDEVREEGTLVRIRIAVLRRRKDDAGGVD
ncbi:methyltransferase domain-containing protein [bacterium]|nr:methyltransferase domain-containing protein [bacterium]